MKKFKIHRAFVLVFTTVILTQPGFTQTQYRFKHYDTKYGLASDLATSIACDSLGFVWVGYHRGLSRFDGYNFKVFKA